MTDTPKLPDKLSDLIELSVTDARKLDPEKYRPVAMHYHSPISINGRCKICNAGAVIAGTLGTSHALRAVPSHFDDDTRRKLYALDHVRTGGFSAAMINLCLPREDHEKLDGLSGTGELAPIRAKVMATKDYVDWDGFREHLNALDDLVGLLRESGL